MDTAGFDFREIVRQGGNIPAALLDEIEAASLEMRRRWLELDARRAA